MPQLFRKLFVFSLLLLMVVPYGNTNAFSMDTVLPSESDKCNPALPNTERFFFDADGGSATDADGSYENPYVNMHQFHVLMEGTGIEDESLIPEEYVDGAVESIFDLEEAADIVEAEYPAVNQTVSVVCFKGEFEIDRGVLPLASRRDLYMGSYGGGAKLPNVSFGMEFMGPHIDYLMVKGLEFESLTIRGAEEVFLEDLTFNVVEDTDIFNPMLELGRVEDTVMSNIQVNGGHRGPIKVSSGGTVYASELTMESVSYGLIVEGVDYLEFFNNQNVSAGISTLSTSGIKEAHVHNNVFKGGVHALESYDPLPMLQGFARNHREYNVYNNFFIDQSSISLDLIHVINLDVINNSFYGNSCAVHLQVYHLDAINNIFDASESETDYVYCYYEWFVNPLDPSSDRPIHLTEKYSGENNIMNGNVASRPFWRILLAINGSENNSLYNVDPKFVANDDLHIASDSPAIAAGLSQTLFADDIDGDARKSWDIGADEF